MTSYPLTDSAVQAFVVLPAVVVLMLVWATEFAWAKSGATWARAKRAAMIVFAISLAWLGLTWTLAARGVLRDFTNTPPPFAVLILGVVGLALLIAYGRVGTMIAAHVPLAALVGAQAFRLPLELAMHRMYERGVMPVQMSYSGQNWDIVTGVTAIVVAALVAAGVAGRRLVLAWNVLGLGLLINVMLVAMVSTPPIRFFGPDRLNVWVTYAPFVWLPAVLVLAALAGHLIVFRAAARPS